MPKYLVFIIAPSRLGGDKTKENDDIKETPEYQKAVHEFLRWTEAEFKAERIKDLGFLLDPSDKTNLRVEFHQTDSARKAETENESDDPTILSTDASVSGGEQAYLSTNILGYYAAEFPTVDEVVAWARSCPISHDGFALEIRELRNTETDLREASTEAREWAGDQIVFMRKKLLEEGRMKREDDGTLWVKVEDEDEIKEIVAEAEERDGKEQ